MREECERRKIKTRNETEGFQNKIMWQVHYGDGGGRQEVWESKGREGSAEGEGGVKKVRQGALKSAGKAGVKKQKEKQSSHILKR